MMKPLVWLLAVAGGSLTAAWAGDMPDYVRYAEDEDGSRLEVAIRTLALPSGQKVDLIGTVHIADRPYYQELNRRFATYDAVLFELVGDPRHLTKLTPDEHQKQAPSGGTLGFIQQAASKHLDLTFQLHGIDYTGDNMVHADLSMDEFQQLQAERGESMATMFVRAMQAQSSGSLDSAAMNELNLIGLLRILVSPDSAAAFKKSLAKMFDQMESMSAAMDGSEGSTILSGRNDVALAKLKDVLAGRKQRHVAVFYGAAHMPGIETALVKELGAKVAGEEWLAAWLIRKQ